MRGKVQLLVIGPGVTRDALARALPDCEVSGAEHALDGVWQTGRAGYDAVVLSLSVGQNALKAVRSLREVAPAARIVVACSATEEPIARAALAEGADEYILEPFCRADLEHVFQTDRAHPVPLPAAHAGPSSDEVVRFSEVLRNLGDGSPATLDRLAALVRDTFDAKGVEIQLDDLWSRAGDVSEAVLEEPLRRKGRPVGRVALARKARGTYGATAAARLAEYARLIEATVTQTRETERWQKLAWTDDLSRLHNRRYFEKKLDELIERATQERLRLTVLLFDIDDFKAYNDHYGHDTGDELIREVARLLTTCTREHDVVARYGGDEFAVIFWDAEEPRVPGSEHPREPMALTERFCHALGAHTFHCLGADAPGPVTISAGLSCFPWDGNTREQLLRAADDALLSAKRTGKNAIQLAGGTERKQESAD